MELPIDFVAALTSEPSVDFVSALSAEQGCDLCHELHASVYELRCSQCEAAICPDCARLRPDTTMACLMCDARSPGRAFPTSHRSRGAMVARLREESATLRLALVQLLGRVRSGEGVIANLRVIAQAIMLGFRERFEARPRISYTRMRALTSGLPARDAIANTTRRAVAVGRRVSARALAYSASASRRAYQASASGAVVLSERASIVLARSRGNASTASRRATALAVSLSARGRQFGMSGARRGARALRTSGAWLSRHGTRLASNTRQASSTFGAGARRGWARSRAVSGRGLAHARDAAVQGWITLRSLPVRQHTAAVLLAMMLLYAVARADHRD
jgi:hypothetical protein